MSSETQVGIAGFYSEAKIDKEDVVLLESQMGHPLRYLNDDLITVLEVVESTTRLCSCPNCGNDKERGQLLEKLDFTKRDIADAIENLNRIGPRSLLSKFLFLQAVVQLARGYILRDIEAIDGCIHILESIPHPLTPPCLLETCQKFTALSLQIRIFVEICGWLPSSLRARKAAIALNNKSVENRGPHTTEQVVGDLDLHVTSGESLIESYDPKYQQEDLEPAFEVILAQGEMLHEKFHLTMDVMDINRAVFLLEIASQFVEPFSRMYLRSILALLRTLNCRFGQMRVGEEDNEYLIEIAGSQFTHPLFDRWTKRSQFQLNFYEFVFVCKGGRMLYAEDALQYSELALSSGTGNKRSMLIWRLIGAQSLLIQSRQGKRFEFAQLVRYLKFLYNGKPFIFPGGECLCPRIDPIGGLLWLQLELASIAGDGYFAECILAEILARDRTPQVTELFDRPQSSLDDLDDKIEVLKKNSAPVPSGSDPVRSFLVILIVSLLARYKLHGDPRDLNEALWNRALLGPVGSYGWEFDALLLSQLQRHDGFLGHTEIIRHLVHAMDASHVFTHPMHVTQCSGLEPGSKQLRPSMQMLEARNSSTTKLGCSLQEVHVHIDGLRWPECRKWDATNIYCGGGHSELAFKAAHDELSRQYSSFRTSVERFEVSCWLAELNTHRFQTGQQEIVYQERAAHYLTQASTDLESVPPPKLWPQQVYWASSVIQVWHRTQHPDNIQAQLFSACDILQKAIAEPQVPPHIRIRYIMTWLNAAPKLPLREEVWGQNNVKLGEQVVDTCELALAVLEESSWMAANIHWSIYNRQYKDQGSIEGVLISIVWSVTKGLGSWGHLLGRAFEVVDATQGIIWKQLIQLRTPLDALEKVDKGLASRLQDVSTKLERYRGACGGDVEPKDQSLLGLRAWRYWHERNIILEHVRKLPGFENFFKVKSGEELHQIGREGPVVLLFLSNTRAEAMIFSASPCPNPRSGHSVDMLVDHQCLPISRAALRNLHTALTSWTNSRSNDPEAGLNPQASTSADPQTENRAGRPVLAGTRSVEDVLESLWESVAKPLIGVILKARGKGKASAWEVPERESRPRIWWCCHEEFSFMPIHAAGIYRGNSPICVSDFFISSYTPSLGALIDARKRPVPVDLKVLVAAQPSPGGRWSELPSVKRELEEVVKFVPCRNLIHLGDNNQPDFDGKKTSVESVLQRVDDASILHFACHGQQIRNDPLGSGFVLSGAQTLSILDLIRHRLPKAHTAILSACYTASNDPVQPGEFVNLASALLFLGFRNILATKWPMEDGDGPLLARTIYRALFPTNGETAPPLHGRNLSMLDLPELIDGLARDLRLQKSPARRWATFVHLGA